VEQQELLTLPDVSWSKIRLITAKLTETPVTTPITEQQPKVRKV
jgi:hypothetical protein